MAEAVFEAQGLRFSYGRTVALDGVDLRVERGWLLGVLGPNGCGKSTLLDLLCAHRRPDTGRVLLEGRPVHGMPRAALARRVALAPQDSGLNFPFSVGEAVLMGRHPHIRRFAAPSAADWAAARRAMAEVEVAHLAHKPVTELSGGERQRVAVARALAQEAPALLLDEPTASLDVNHGLAVLRGLERRARQEGRTVVAVLHDINLAAAFCDHVALLKQGRVYAAGPVEEVLTTANIAAVFGVEARVAWSDYAGALVATLRKPGGEPCAPSRP